MDKTYISINTIEGSFTLILRETGNDRKLAYQVYKHDHGEIEYIGKIDPYMAECDFDNEDVCDEGFLDAIEDLLIDSIQNGEL